MGKFLCCIRIITGETFHKASSLHAHTSFLEFGPWPRFRIRIEYYETKEVYKFVSFFSKLMVRLVSRKVAEQSANSTLSNHHLPFLVWVLCTPRWQRLVPGPQGWSKISKLRAGSCVLGLMLELARNDWVRRSRPDWLQTEVTLDCIPLFPYIEDRSLKAPSMG